MLDGLSQYRTVASSPDPLHVPVLGPTSAQIGVFGVTSNLDATGQASRVAARTGGEVVSCATPDQLAGVAYAAIKKVVNRALTAAT